MEFKLSDVCNVLGTNHETTDFGILADPSLCRVLDWSSLSLALVTPAGVKRICEQEGRGDETTEVLRLLVFGKRLDFGNKPPREKKVSGPCSKTTAIHRFLVENVDVHDLARALRELPEIMDLFQEAAATNAARDK